MNPRQKLSAILLCLGCILAVLPLTSHRSFSTRPGALLKNLGKDPGILTVDQVARMMAEEDRALQLIDLRDPEDFRTLSIPGSVNVPYSAILDSDPDRFLNDPGKKYVFYSEGDLKSNYALTIARGLGYGNTFVMKGGLNEWFATVMNTDFSGNRITARENALFGNRMKARRLFTSINSLPDSLKQKYLEASRISARKLDGGCE